MGYRCSANRCLFWKESRLNKTTIPRLVLAISQAYEENSAREGSVPRADFDTLAESVGATIVGQRRPRGVLARRFERYTALDVAQAMHVVRCYPEADAYVSFSERIGIPLGMILARRKRRRAHLMIAHRLDTRAKRLLAFATGWQRGVDRVITLCSTQLWHAERLAPGRAAMIKAGYIDERFYHPTDALEEDFVLSVGSENRDYATLVDAVLRTTLKLKVLSSSPWCRKTQPSLSAASGQVEFLPRVSYTEVRDLYQRARLVVVPLNDVEYAAGLSGVMEAFCMHKPLIVTASRGIADYVVDGQNACVVQPHDADGLAGALRVVSEDEELAAALRQGAARAVRDYANQTAFVKALECEIGQAIERNGRDNDG